VANPLIGRCPVCGDSLEVVRLECGRCHTAIEGRFSLSRLARLNDEQLQFVDIFLRVRGNIREMERELGISYPTVRSRLDGILQAMGYAIDEPRDDETAERRREILDQLQAGKINPDEAVKLLRQRR
jgi:hypothetical protein